MVVNRWMVCIPAAVVMSGCFASQSDIRVLQSDLSLIRSENAAADSARRAQMEQILGQINGSIRVVSDSVNAVNSRLVRFRSDVSTSLASIDQQLLAIQELTGQSQRKLQDMRASLEERQGAPAPTTDGATKSPADGAPTDGAPGPNQLFQIAREQMMQGSNETARQAFEDLLQQYPKADVAVDAQYYIAETYAAEGNGAAADSVYARVIAKYAGTSRAANALYKRAVFAQNEGKGDVARKMFNELIKKYPRSDEAVLAKDRVKRIPE
jgi:tol-pal system protein YbgF